MRPNNGIRPVRFSQVFNQKAWDQLCQKNVTLKHIDFPSRQVDIALSECVIRKKARHTSRLTDRKVARGNTFVWFSRLFRRRRQNVGRKLFNAYATFLTHGDPVSDGIEGVHASGEIDLNQPEHFRLGCAFVAAGACRWNGNGELDSTEQVIDRGMVDRIDALINGSCTRLAYEFIAQNKSLPKGFLQQIFVPHFLDGIVNQASMPETEGRSVLEDILASPAVNITGEADITLEHVMELKNRLLQMGLWQREAPEHVTPSAGASVARPRLPVPQSRYQCDSEDLWLIRYQVEHHRFLKFASDFAHRIRQWAQRNKRIIGLEVVEVVTVGIITGITTGGIGAAVYLGSRVIFKMIQVGIQAAIAAVRSAFSRRKVDRVEAELGHRFAQDGSQSLDSREVKDIASLDNPGEDDPHRNIRQLLDGTEYLSREHSLTNMTNLLLDMKNLSDDLNRLQFRAGDSVADSIRLQKLYTLALQHSARFDESAKDYDKMVVAGVQKVSALNSQFERVFKPLWEPFRELPDDRIDAIFNEAANHSSVKGRWYLTREDCLHWIQTIVPEEPGNLSSRLIRERIGQAIIGRDTARDSVNVSSNKARCKVVKVALFGGKLAFSYAWGRIKPYRMINQILEVLGNHLERGTRPGIDLFKPIVTPIWAGVFVFLYVADKVTCYINNKRNRRRSRDIQRRVNASGDGAVHNTKAPTNISLSVDDWQAMRRQAKHLSIDYIKTVKRLIRVLDTLSEHANVKPPTDPYSLEYQDYLVKTATCMLRYKMLMRELESQLYGSVGFMHHMGVQHKLRFDQRLRCIQIAE
ncbi:MAG: hypothetical protein B0D91_07885 [Oceanospirillales bacterium LUC14_002_19_P2]|nr:MAG: hypothetical protein B0D91_07885 [Oceanospirillales bacterium LUC14_002_19_P2]